MIFPRVIILQAKSTRLSNLGTVNIVKYRFCFHKLTYNFFSMDQHRKIASVVKLARNIQNYLMIIMRIKYLS